MATISTITELEAIYGVPAEGSMVKVTDVLTEDYQAFIVASPFLTLATSGPQGLDCSPRGDQPGFVRVVDQKTLQLPDRRGNNRVDSLRNIILDPRVALLFFVPGSGTTLRVNGQAEVRTDHDLCRSFAVERKIPRTVIVVNVEEVYFQCARAIMRSGLWNPETQVDAKCLPTPGQMLARLSGERLGGEAYDQEWPDRANKSLW